MINAEAVLGTPGAVQRPAPATVTDVSGDGTVLTVHLRPETVESLLDGDELVTRVGKTVQAAVAASLLAASCGAARTAQPANA